MGKFIPENHIIIISGILLLLSSCATQTCFEETESFVKVSFYDKLTKELLPPDSVTIYGMSMDTNKLYDNSKKLQPALLPLNNATDNCVFIISINGINDTVGFTYSSFPHLVSIECGYTYYHDMDTASYTKNIIDSISLSNRKITTLNGENVRIFY